MSNHLAHYGVPGMKWGKRKAGSKPLKESKDHKAVQKLRTKKLAELDNDEITKLTNRMGLEKRYKDLNPSKFTTGQKKAAVVLATVGMVNAIVSLPNSPAGKLVKSAFEKKPKPNQLAIGR